MAFPTNPTNGQQANVNGVIYIYSTTLTAWTVLTNTGANVSANNIAATNNITAATISATGNIVTQGFVLGNGSLLTGVSTTSANINNGTSNITVVSSGGNITASVGGTANVVQWATTGEYVTGLVSATGNVQGGNLRTAGLISATGAVTAASVVGGVITGTSTSVTGATTAASVVGGVITGTSTSVTGNVTGGNILTAGLISSTGNITGGNISATNHTGTTVSVTGVITGASVVGGVITGTSVSVTGNITAGNLLISGAIVDSAQLDIQTSASNANIVLTPNGTGNVNTPANVSITGNVQGGNIRTVGLVSATGNITGGNILVSSALSVGGNITSRAILETATITAAAPAAPTNFDIVTQAVQYYTANANANVTLNFRGNATVTANVLLATGQSTTIALLWTNGASAFYPNVIQVDGANVTPKWQGGSAVTAGNANAVDVYAFTIIKTAATPTYVVLGSQTKFA